MVCAVLAAACAFGAVQWLWQDAASGTGAVTEQARAYAAQIAQRLQLADQSLRATANDLRDAPAEPGRTTQRYFDALARSDAGGAMAPLHGAIARLPPLRKLDHEELARGDSVILSIPRPQQRPRVMMLRRPGGAAHSGDLLLATLAPEYLWDKFGAPGGAVEACVRDDADRVLFCSGSQLEAALSGLPRPAGGESSGALAGRFRDKTVQAGFARLDLPVSAFSGIWTVVVADPQAAPGSGPAHIPENARAWLAALLAGAITLWLGWRFGGDARPAAAADRTTQSDRTPAIAGGAARAQGGLERQRRAINAMAEIDRAILSGAEADRLVALAARLMRTSVDCDFAMFALHDREGHSGMTLIAGPGDNEEPRHGATIVLPPATLALMNAQPDGLWTDRPGDLAFLESLATHGVRSALLLPLHEDNRLAGVVALGMLGANTPGSDGIAHARALVARLGVALTAANRARSLYAHTHFDTTTGLPNRRFLREHLGPQIARTRRDDQRLAVLFIDIDGFKQVNASAGHDGGDLILAEAAARLRACVREEDILARFGGDEFVAVLPRIANGMDARKVADKLVATLTEPYAQAGGIFQLGASIGISLFPDDAKSVDELLRHADFAMSRAKAAGRGQYASFNEEVNRKAGERARLEGELRRATENGEFIVYYQPQIALVGGTIEGAEALVRWRHPKRGMVAPGEFISVAEQSSLILLIGEQVLRAACAQYSQWEIAGVAPRRVSVNVTVLELRRPDFASRIESILAEYGLRPFCLELEITESSLLENSAIVLSQLEHLRKRGIRIAFDDFGTGYSSLAYLKRLPVDVVKIDQSFVRDIGADSDSASITRAIIDMAHNLGKTVVAEGVETDEQRTLLRDLGCEVGQGYLWSRPVPADEFERMSRAWKPSPRPAAPLRLVSA